MVQNSVEYDDFFFFKSIHHFSRSCTLFFFSFLKKLIYNVVLLSAVQQSESVISTHMSILGIILLGAVL